MVFTSIQTISLAKLVLCSDASPVNLPLTAHNATQASTRWLQDLSISANAAVKAQLWKVAQFATPHQSVLPATMITTLIQQMTYASLVRQSQIV